MVITLTVIACLILVALIYLSTLPGDYELKVTKALPANIDEVFDKIVDLESWNDWSPWLMHEPNCPIEFSGNTREVGGSYSWDGQMVGAGTMEHVVLDRPNHTEQKLSFTRPFKSVCKVGFDLEPAENGTTKVTWHLQGTMPFLFRPMIRRTKEMISQDFETGLAMLGGVLDPASEYPRFEFLGAQQRASTTYLAIPWEGTWEDMPEAMQKGFAELGEYVKSGKVVAAGQPFSVIHKAKKRATYFVIDMAIPVAEGTQDNKYPVKQIEGGKFHQTQLKGSYDFLKSAWYSAMSHLKMTKTKLDWKRPCVELYENNLRDIEDTNDLVTSIFVPVK